MDTKLDAIRFTPKTAQEVVHCFDRISPLPYDQSIQQYLNSSTQCSEENCKFAFKRGSFQTAQYLPHYCRKCLRIICKQCGKNFLKIPFFDRPLRHCATCFNELQEILKTSKFVRPYFQKLEDEAKKVPSQVLEKELKPALLNKQNVTRVGEEVVKTSAVIAIKSGGETAANTGVQVVGSFLANVGGAAAGAAVIAVPFQGGLMVYEIVHLKSKLDSGDIDKDKFKVSVAAESGRFVAAVGGAIGGAVIGSVIPGVGTVVGIVVGGVLGGVISLTAGSTVYFGITHLGSRILRHVRSLRPTMENIEDKQKLVKLMASKVVAIEMQYVWKNIELVAQAGQHSAQDICDMINQLVLNPVGTPSFDTVKNIENKLHQVSLQTQGCLSLPFRELETFSIQMLEVQAQKQIEDPIERIEAANALDFLRKGIVSLLANPFAQQQIRNVVEKIKRLEWTAVQNEKLRLLLDIVKELSYIPEMYKRSANTDDQLGLLAYSIYLASTHSLEQHLKMLCESFKELNDGYGEYAYSMALFESAVQHLAEHPWRAKNSLENSVSRGNEKT